MNFKATAFALVSLLTTASGAQAQVPSVAAAWGDMKLSQKQCLDRGVAVFNRLNYKRVEAIAYTVYADFQKFQLAIRCVPDKDVYFVFGGGPGDDEKPLLVQIDAIKAEFDR